MEPLSLDRPLSSCFPCWSVLCCAHLPLKRPYRDGRPSLEAPSLYLLLLAACVPGPGDPWVAQGDLKWLGRKGHRRPHQHQSQAFGAQPCVQGLGLCT